MNKKTIITGCIISAIILVLVTFTSVVGYQTVESTNAGASPLFTIRTKRAINEDSDALTCEYVGKGKLMPFPRRNSKTVLIQKAIDRISRLDDKEFNKFISLVIYHFDKSQDRDTQEITIAFHQLRDNPEMLTNYVFNVGNNNSYTILDMRWNPGCLILFIAALALIGIIFILDMFPN